MSPAVETTIGDRLRAAPEQSGGAGLELPASHVVRLITSGVAALAHEAGGPAVCLIGAGELEGLQRAAGFSDGLHARLLTPATWREMAIDEIPSSAAYGVTMEAAQDAWARLDVAAMELTCATRHPIDRRLARWLLEIDSLVDGEDIQITQAALAEMLSVQRTSISPVVMKLKAAKAIRSTRNNIIVDRPALAVFACGCRVDRNPAVGTDLS